MKIGITQIILRKYSLDEIIALCQRAGYEIIELVFSEGGDPDVNMSDADLKALRARLDAAGIEVTSVIAHYKEQGNFLDPSPQAQELRMRSLVRSIEIAGAMGVGAVLLHPGQLSVDISYTQAWENFRAHMRAVAPIAAQHQVAVGIENVWNKFLLSPKEMREFIDEVDSPWVGCYLDTANMMAYGYPEQWIDELGQRIKRVHFKDFNRRQHAFVPLQEGDTDWPRIMAKLRAIGYNAGVIHEVSGDLEFQVEMARRMRAIVA